MNHPADGLETLKGALIESLNRLIRSVAAKGGITPDAILELTLVGNTAMHHILLGIDPRPLGVSPFIPAILRSLDIKARDLALAVHPAANCHVLPIEAGFVGADNVAVLIAEEPYRQEEMVLIIDVGTNGEMVLGNRERLLSASCATGPALEGAHIRFGMRAAPGAIERIRIDPQDQGRLLQDHRRRRAGGRTFRSPAPGGSAARGSSTGWPNSTGRASSTATAVSARRRTRRVCG